MTIRSGVLMVGSIEDWTSPDDCSVPFAILIAISNERPTPKLLQVLRAIATSTNCLELSLVGPGSEALHDYADQIAEDSGRIDLVTTWHEDEAPEDVASYFLHAAGGTPELLVAIVEEGNPIRQAIENTAIHEITEKDV